MSTISTLLTEKNTHRLVPDPTETVIWLSFSLLVSVACVQSLASKPRSERLQNNKQTIFTSHKNCKEK